jgi:hypothetical protein
MAREDSHRCEQELNESEKSVMNLIGISLKFLPISIIRKGIAIVKERTVIHKTV